MSTTTAEETKGACPTCGARIRRSNLSLCAYCGSPLVLPGARAQGKDHATMRRLAAMREHAAFPDAQRWTPPDGPDGLALRAALRLGLALVLIGLVSAGLVLLAGASPLWSALGLLLAALGGVLWLRASLRLRALRALPVLARPALVVERRSRTSENGRARTTYYFDLMFEDGALGEFRYPGRGGNQELYVAGNTGVAYTRRDELLALRLIRV